jgi:hypothetical protein
VKSVRIPYDVGRLPSNVFDDSDGNSGITANQWKIYITCYARPCMYNLIPVRAYKSLVMLSEIVTMMVSPVFTDELITKLHRLLHEHHEQFSRVYGKWSMSVNYHMSLHLPSMIMDMGPPHVFWCFGYERMNGILAGAPKSNRSVALEVANRFVRDTTIATSNIPHINVPYSLREFVTQEDDDDDNCYPYPQTFFLLTLLNGSPERESRFEIQQDLDRGLVKCWPICFKHPSRLNTKCDANLLSEMQYFFEDLVYGVDLDYIDPRICKFGRCEVNGQKFSSDFNSTDRGSVVKVMFVDGGGELSPYFGIVKFYFTANIVVKKERIVNHLTYVTWLKPKWSTAHPLSHLYAVGKEVYKKDRIITPRRFLCRCVLVRPKPTVPLYLISELTKW